MNLVLTGFMGAGKSSVGRAAAQLLDREFVDMDEVISAREAMPVAAIFAQRGEGYFRERERELCGELGSRSNLVIATGGGTLIDPTRRAAFDQATVICLDADIDEILRRLNGAIDRPLAEAEAGEDKRDRLTKLLSARQPAYAQIPIHVKTTGRTIDAVARQVVEIFQGSVEAHRGVPLRVRTPEGSYDVWLAHGLLDQVGAILARAEWARRCAVVTNPTVGRLYAGRLVAWLGKAGFDPVVLEIPDGEAHKTPDTVRTLYDGLVSAKIERRSPLLALGGGVVGDVAGFAAATFLRGVPFVQIPTTLLAMVDASVGGKVGVDHPSGKNLIGAFKFPEAVIADTDLLQTLPVEEFRAGMAEVIKHAVIGDESLFEDLMQIDVKGRASLRPDQIARALRVKIDLVERDPFEAGVRAHLNLGHTFAHALEAVSGYQLRHGYAVAIGVATAARLAVRIGWCDRATRDRIIELLEHVSLPTHVPAEWSSAEILAAMGADKKIRDGRLRLVLPRAIGRVDIAQDLGPEEIIAALEEGREPSSNPGPLPSPTLGGKDERRDGVAR